MISHFSQQWLSKLCRLVEPFFDEAPYDALYDDISRLTLAEKWSSYRAGFHLLRESVSSRKEMTEFFELLFSNSSKTLKSWFHSEPLLSTLVSFFQRIFTPLCLILSRLLILL